MSSVAPLDLVVTPQSYWPVLGGAERLVTEVVERLAARAHRVRVMVPVALRDWDGPLALPSTELRRGVEIERVRPTSLDARVAARAVGGKGLPARLARKALKRRLERRYEACLDARLAAGSPDVLLATPHLMPAVRSAARLARPRGAALTLVPLLHEGQEGWPEARMRETLALADSVVASTDHEASRLVDGYGVDPDAIRVAGTGAELPAQTLPWPRPPRVLYLGRKVPGKGLLELIDAMEQVWSEEPGAELVLAGLRLASTRAVDERCAALAPEHRARVRSLDSVSESDKQQLLGEATCLVLPSLHEAFGIVLLEAWSARTPVVAYDMPVQRSVVEPGVDGLLVPPTDPLALGAAILRMLREPQTAERFGRRGYEKVAAKHRWEHVVDSYEEALRLAVERASKRLSTR